MAYLKQDDVSGNGKSKPKGKKREAANTAKTPESLAAQHEVNYVAGMAGIEESLDWIARGVNSLTADGKSVSLHTGQPLKLTLAENEEDDALDRLTTALERIADSVTRLAGLSRPRLEQWHEQGEYEPRFRSSACDGGAPGPRKASDSF